MSTVEETYGPRMFRSATIASAAGLLALSVAACADGTGTGPDGARPANIEAVSPESTSVEAPVDGGSPLRVRVTAAEGTPLEGVEVRFLLTGGPGRVAPTTAATGADGGAEALYLPGGEPGTARIRVDAPEAPWIAPVAFRRAVRPGRELRLEAAGGSEQRAEAGSQLPVPLTVSVRSTDGAPEPGTPVAFAVAESPGAAALSADTALTGEEGRASTLLTLADRPGTHRVRAAVAGPAAADTILFRAEAVAALDADLRLDSARPTPARAGQDAVLFGRGLDAADEVWLDGAAVPVHEAEAGRVRVRLPEDGGCRPRREVTLRVRSAAGAWSNGLRTELVPAAAPLRLDPGEARTLAAPGPGECVRLPATTGHAYRVAVVSAARSSAGLTPLTLRVRAGVGGLAGRGGAQAAARPGRDDADAAPPPTPADRRTAPRGEVSRGPMETRLRSAARAELRARGARPARGGASRRSARGAADGAGAGADRAPAPSPSAVGRAAAEGDTARFHFAVGPDLGLSCTDTTDLVTGVVRAAGPGVAVVRDTAAPGGFTDEDFRLIRDEFEQLVLPTDTTYFGPPADIDGNGRVILLLTPRVNDLTPPGAQSRVGGFFLPLDLADAGPGGGGVSPGEGVTCPASNEGEVLYLATADPEGEHGPPLDRTAALRNARSIGSHELEHLLSAEQRVIHSDGSFADLQSVWLAEGMAHLAEEVVGHAALDPGPGSDLDLGDFEGSRERLDVFNVFHLQNFGRLQLFLQNPAATPALAPVDPGGAAGLRMRGFAWLFSRWLGDHAAGGGGEARLFRRLSAGGPSHLTGVENVESATGDGWRDLLLEFVRVPVLDGRELAGGGGTEGAASTLATWDLRALYRGLSENPSAGSLFPLGYPLSPTPARSGGLHALELPAGAPSYFAAGGSAPTPALAFELTSADGSAPPASASVHVTVIRVR